MRKYVLDKTIEGGVDFRAETDKAFIIEKVGTTSTSIVNFVVAGSPVLSIRDWIASTRQTTDNMNPLLALGPQYIVIPPGKPFKFEGASGTYLRIVGNILVFEPDEVLPSAGKARFMEQPRIYKSCLDHTYSSAAAATITARSVVDTWTETVPAGEKWTLAELFMSEVWTTATPPSIARERLAFRISVDDLPYDVVEWDMGKLGIYGTAAPCPAKTDTSVTIFSLAEKPIELTEGRTIKVEYLHLGDSDVTLAAGETLEVRGAFVFVKEILG